MPGQCYSCGTEFSIFKKEHGCKNCGYSCCSKCLHSKSIPIPKRNNAKHHVCFQCYKILTGQETKETTESQHELPQAYIKRMEALKEREQTKSQAKSVGGRSQEIPAHIRKLDKPDREIALRLERLKESNKPMETVTNADIAARLANLQGQPHQTQQKPTYQPVHRKLEGQQVDDLLDEIAAEVEIDEQTDPAKDIQTRLDHLRNDPDDKTKGSLQQPGETKVNRDSPHSVLGLESMDKKNMGINSEDSQSATGGVDMLEIQRLMEQAALEMDVDAKKAISGMQKDKELMERLRQIQADKEKDGNEATCAGAGSDDAKLESSYSSEEDEEEAAKRIIQRYLEEAKIDDSVGNSSSIEVTERGKQQLPKTEKPTKPSKKENIVDDKDDDYEDPDELPYCCICTEDAAIRCRNCDMDLFCQRCFRECHNEMDIMDHRTTPFKMPKGYQ